MGRLGVCCLIVLTSTSFISSNAGRVAKFDSLSADRLLEHIGEARKRLESEQVEILSDVVGSRRVRIGRRKYRTEPVIGVVGREMALAILDVDGNIQIARGIKRDKGLDVLTPGFILSVRRDNGINSDISCVMPSGGKVLAVKYPIDNKGNRFGARGEVIQAIYTPYSAEIKSEDLIERGIKVQNDFIEKAYIALEKRGVMSLAYTGKKVIDVVRRDVLTVLLMNEHIDPSLFKSSGLTRPLVEQVLTTIATNRERAYAYSISSAGARGLIQMIPSTYYLIARKYPLARLNPNFIDGMIDPVNAVMAQVLLCDSDWQAIRSREDVGPERIGPYLAAAYNGGVGRVLSVFAHDETDWMESPEPGRKPTMTVTKRVPVRVRTRRGRKTKYVLKSYTQPIFRSETSKYVRQYHWINDYFVGRNTEGFKELEE